jgi:hypothetical protein
MQTRGRQADALTVDSALKSEKSNFGLILAYGFSPG